MTTANKVLNSVLSLRLTGQYDHILLEIAKIFGIIKKLLNSTTFFNVDILKIFR